jgi:hypothetical protein
MVDAPYIEIYFADAAKVQNVNRVFGRFSPVHLGPGFRRHLLHKLR